MSANAAVALFTLGMLLLFLECNRPGFVLPGAAGLLLLLLSAYRLRLEPVDSAALSLGACAAVAMAFAWRLPLRSRSTGLYAPALCALLCGAAAVRIAGGSDDLSRQLAGVCGSLLGGLSALLLTIAGAARRAKQRLGRISATPSPFATAEHWGVD